MFWAVIVAAGVAVVSMTFFATWLTRRQAPEPPVEEFSPSPDPTDPWAAYRPRPFEDMIERPRPRLWPLVTGLVGLVLVGGGIAGARQNASLEAIAPLAPTQAPSTFVLEVEETPPPTAAPTATPVPTAAPTAKPAATKAPVAAKPQASKSPTSATTTGSPTISGSAGCQSGALKVSFTANGTSLSWFAIYIDKQVFKGGPISGNSYAASAGKTVEPGTHEVEITVDDKSGRRARKLFQVTCT